MNLIDINPRTTAKKLNRFYESRFGFNINFNTLTVPRARRIYRQIEENLQQLRKQFGIYKMEQNPKYAELVSVKEGLAFWIRQNQVLLENQTAKAEVEVAAKGMVDEIQDMVEKISKMQNEDLATIVTSARDMIGMQQANQYKSTADTALTAILDVLKAQRESLEMAVRGLSGEEVGGTMAVGQSTSEPAAGPEVDQEPPETAPAGMASPMGRELR
jgi:hypothetical protein